MRISKTVSYAIAAIAQLALHRSDSPLSTAKIACGAQVPERYLMQIMKALKDAGLLEATRGVRGGYKLAKPIGWITLQDVCDAVDGRHIPETLAIQSLSATSQRLIVDVLADIADDERRRLGGFALDALQSSN